MEAEVRADGLHISGYVNVPGRLSARPVITRAHGKVMEVIEQRAFADAISRNGDITMLLDHDKNRVLASTKDGSLTLKEDNVGLRADAIVTDKEVIENADKLRGWSFEMRNIVDSIEKRAESLPLRHIKSFDMPEVSLILHKNPVYSATSVEVRADDTEEEAEIRADTKEFKVTKKPIDYSDYKNRICKARIIQ